MKKTLEEIFVGLCEEPNFNDLYIGVNGKLHDLLVRCDDIEDMLQKQIEADDVHRL